MFLIIMVALAPSFCLVALGGLIRNRLSENAWIGCALMYFSPNYYFLLLQVAPYPCHNITDACRECINASSAGNSGTNI